MQIRMVDMRNRDWPYWSDNYSSARDFRAKKRKEVSEALSALHDLCRGSAYTPASKNISDAIKLLEDAKLSMSIKQWKR